ncbi:MAG: RDD family protein [Rickettsiaceae bacterium]
MQKQIIYVGFITRGFALIMDLLIISLLVQFISKAVTPFIFNNLSQEFLTTYNTNFSQIIQSQDPEVMEAFNKYLTQNPNIFIYFMAVFVVINISIAGIFFVSFWYYCSATPGKLLLRIKIASDDNENNKLTIGQLIKRFFGYFTAIFGVWSLFFNPKKQTLHDKIARTIVIKN